MFASIHFPSLPFTLLQISEIANAFYQALHMPEDERMRRISIASEFVTRVTTQRWALAVMLDLKGVHKSVSPVQNYGAGLGLGYRLLGMDIGFSSLDFNRAAKVFKNARSRLILMDYGGTIASNDNVSALSGFCRLSCSLEGLFALCVVFLNTNILQSLHFAA